MIARLGQKLGMPNEMCLNLKKYAFHEFIVIVLHFSGTSSVWVQFLA